MDHVPKRIFHVPDDYDVHCVKQHSGLVAFGCIGGQLLVVDAFRLPDFFT